MRCASLLDGGAAPLAVDAPLLDDVVGSAGVLLPRRWSSKLLWVTPEAPQRRRLRAQGGAGDAVTVRCAGRATDGSAGQPASAAGGPGRGGQAAARQRARRPASALPRGAWPPL